MNSKEGYYGLRGIHRSFARRHNGRWEPWEQRIQIMLRPVKNPVPMYAKYLSLILPVAGRSIGYDLAKADWLPPYGHGEHGDFEFFLESSVESRTNYHVTLRLHVPGAHNGIQSYNLSDQSAVKLFYEAPVEGYIPTWEWHNSRTTENKPYAISVIVDDAQMYPERRFIYRVRSVVDAEGRLISAWYGKIYGPGDLGLRADNQWQIRFLYYLNPDSTRNLEFDPKQNLFQDEKVTAP